MKHPGDFALVARQAVKYIVVAVGVRLRQRLIEGVMIEGEALMSWVARPEFCGCSTALRP